MPVFRLIPDLVFPDPSLADPDGLLAVGGDLSVERLKLAYENGIFPWYNEDPILWHSPDPRFVLFPDELRISRSLKKVIKKNLFEITINQSFHEVIDACIENHSPKGTWITNEMKNAYIGLYEAGIAVSVESRQNGKLVGGLYGVKVRGVFCGESMFFHVSDAARVAFVYLIEKMRECGYLLLDAQVYTENMARYGARSIPRSQYLEILKKNVQPAPLV